MPKIRQRVGKEIFNIMNKFPFLALVAIMLIISFGSCETRLQSLEITPSSKTMYVGETVEVCAYNHDGAIQWTSTNSFVAADIFEGSIANPTQIKAKHIGTTTIQAEVLYGVNKGLIGFCEITVVPKYNYYNEPIFAWGKSKSYIKSKLGVPDYQEPNIIAYVVNQTRNIFMYYMFTNDKLTSVVVMADSNKTDNVYNFIEERYQPYTGEYNGYWGDALEIEDAQILVDVELDIVGGGYHTITYMENYF